MITDQWGAYQLFMMESLTLFVLLMALVGVLFFLFKGGKGRKQGVFKIICLNHEYFSRQLQLAIVALPKAEIKELVKRQKATDLTKRPKLFVIHFKGDMQAHATEALRRAITTLLPLATPQDEILLKLESPGGLVHAYGEAAGELVRIRKAKIPLKVAVDRVAASGGYLMAAVANEILASPFALIGSIGVVSQSPNFNRFLKERGIDFELLTAGEYKRTLTLFGENDEKGREKAQEQVNEVHHLFQDFIKQQRPSLNLAQVATGEYWYGQKALEMGLIDQLMGSEDYLTEAVNTHHVLEFKAVKVNHPLRRWLGQGAKFWLQ